MTILEVCIDDPMGFQACIDGGADRIELCSALALGGLTPSLGVMQLARDVPIPTHVMIRPVSGGFVLTEAQFRSMLGDIQCARDLGLAGVVLGALSADGTLDLPKMQAFCDAAGPMVVTLHRAIDTCADPLLAIDQAADLGVGHVLTSGGALAAFDGCTQIAAMVKRAAGRVAIMAGAGVTAKNAQSIMAMTGVTHMHASCAVSVEEAPAVPRFGFGPVQRRQTDAATIRELKAAMAHA